MEILDKYFAKYISTSHILCICETKFDKLCINLAVDMYWMVYIKKIYSMYHLVIYLVCIIWSYSMYCYILKMRKKECFNHGTNNSINRKVFDF